ncbi:Ubiquitin specific protease 2 [Carabus blaptoides fortunei]
MLQIVVHLVTIRFKCHQYIERSSISTLSMIDSVADLRNKYSPASYVPAVYRKQSEHIARSKSINDIGRPPIERPEALKSTTIKSKKEAEPVAKQTSVATAENETSKMDVSDGPKPYNHTTNFASYIPVKDFTEGEQPMNQTEDAEMESSENSTQLSYQQQRILNANNDISTSPRLNRASISQNSSGSGTQSSTSNNISSIGTTQRSSSSPIDRDRNRDDDRFGASSVKKHGLNGLKNIGNTCFMNSVIQCLSNTKYLLEYVREDGYLADINTTISGMKGALIKAFSQVIQELWSPDSSDRVVNTVALKSQIQRFAPRFMGYAQQDAQEFLRYLLEGLHEDVNRVTAKPTPILTEIDEKLSDAQKATESWQRYLRMDNSRVVDIFVGQLKSTLRCTHCGHCSVTFDPFWDLSLPIPQRQGPLRLTQCLEHFTREETMDGDEKPTCSKCKERRKCTKSFSIQKFPKILVIHLKRFSPTERFRGKLNVVIDFPLLGLDLSSYAANKSQTECLYNLYAISNHSGTTYSGHYTGYCKHPYTGQWHEYNDSRVSSISPKNVVSSEAYVLFYELVGPHAHL